MVQKSNEKWRFEPQKCVLDAIVAFDEGRFFVAHEGFEDGMRATQGDARLWLQALAQVAASHYLLTLGRGRAAVRTWRKARVKLAQIGQLAPEFAEAMESFHARLGVDADGPRFIEPILPGLERSFPSDRSWPRERRS